MPELTPRNGQTLELTPNKGHKTKEEKRNHTQKKKPHSLHPTSSLFRHGNLNRPFPGSKSRQELDVSTPSTNRSLPAMLPRFLTLFWHSD